VVRIATTNSAELLAPYAISRVKRGLALRIFSTSAVPGWGMDASGEGMGLPAIRAYSLDTLAKAKRNGLERIVTICAGLTGAFARNGFDLLNPLCEHITTRQVLSVFVSLNALSDVDRESRCQMKKMDRYLAA
jgi:hypothetical protein